MVLLLFPFMSQYAKGFVELDFGWWNQNISRRQKV